MKNEYRGNKIGIVFLLVIGLLLEFVVHKVVNSTNNKITSITTQEEVQSGDSDSHYVSNAESYDEYSLDPNSLPIYNHSKEEIITATSFDTRCSISYYFVLAGRYNSNGAHISIYYMYNTFNDKYPSDILTMRKFDNGEVLILTNNGVSSDYAIHITSTGLKTYINFNNGIKDSPDLEIDIDGNYSASKRLISYYPQKEHRILIAGMISCMASIATNIEYPDGQDQYFAYTERLSDVPNIQD